MKKYELFYFISVSIIQIVFYIALYEITNRIAHKMGMVYSRGVAWGISAEVYLIVYVSIIPTLNIVNIFFPKKSFLFSLISAVFFAGNVIPVLDTVPYRGGLVILIGVAGIFIGHILLRRFRMN